MVTVIAAIGRGNVLGKDNKLLWSLPKDLKRFKTLTSGHHIIMGRKTFESLPFILPNRTHIIISRQENYKVNGCLVVNSLEKAIESVAGNQDSFIIGGGEIYKLAIAICDVIELTEVDGQFEADTFFPDLPKNAFELIATEKHHRDEKHDYDFSFLTYKRK